MTSFAARPAMTSSSAGLGDDRLSGGRGKDKLIGGDGSDSFVFDEGLGKANADKIAGFNKKADNFLLDADLFDGLGVGSLKKKAYFEGDAAHDANDRIIFTDKGKLLFDADGKGGEKAVMFAKVGKDVDLSHHDFLVIRPANNPRHPSVKAPSAPSTQETDPWPRPHSSAPSFTSTPRP